jgi:hypothetical protein
VLATQQAILKKYTGAVELWFNLPGMTKAMPVGHAWQTARYKNGAGSEAKQ